MISKSKERHLKILLAVLLMVFAIFVSIVIWNGSRFKTFESVPARQTASNPSDGSHGVTDKKYQTYKNSESGLSFRYPGNWFVKETSDRGILVSPDITFDSENRMIGENAPIEIRITDKSVIDDIVQEYGSVPSDVPVNELVAKEISYEGGLGENPMVISIPWNNEFIEIWLLDQESKSVFSLVISSLQF